MGSRLNPDGAKIKTLRIQRGWTQEQLAEIAGVSPRTIQRAEAMERAAFETLRAVAGAFETNFDQLLKSEAGERFAPEALTAPEPAPIPVPCDPVIAGRFESPRRRAWGTYRVPCAALAAGLLAGVALMYRFDTASVPAPTAAQPGSVSNLAAQVPDSDAQTTGLSGAGASPARRTPQAPLAPAAKPVEILRTDAAASAPLEHRRSAARAPEIFGPAAFATETALDPPVGSENLELPLKTRDLMLTPPVLQYPVAWIAPSAPAAGFSEDPQSAGAVRQAMGQAGKKTGAFLARFGSSVKRAF